MRRRAQDASSRGILRRQLVYHLGPFALDHGARLVGDIIGTPEFEHVLVQPLVTRAPASPAVRQRAMVARGQPRDNLIGGDSEHQ